MPKLKLKTIKEVNIRMGSAERLSTNLKGILKQGVIFEMECVEVKGKAGENNNSNIIWYKDKNGDYLWSGGFEVVDTGVEMSNVGLPKDENELGWHIKDFNINEIWKTTKGAGVKVAILDSGLINNHPDINYDNIIKTKNFLYAGDDKALKRDITDDKGHGTNCTGVIAAQRLCGVAPEVSLLIGKVSDKNSKVNDHNLFRGIKWAYENDADIISISSTVKKFKPEYLKEISQMDEKFKGIIVASLMNLKDPGFNYDHYPASLTETIAVGAINKDLKMDEMTCRSSKMDVMAPGRDILTTEINGELTTKSGCSMATPFVAAVLALLIASNKKASAPISKLKMKERLVSHVSTYVNFNKPPIGKYPVIDPIKLLNLKI